MRVKLISVTQTKYGAYKATFSYGTGYFAAHPKHKDPCKEHKKGPLEPGAEIIKTFDLILRSEDYAQLLDQKELKLYLMEP